MKNNYEAISVEELLSEDSYIIPIYQRNYAWGQSEINQLIDDISIAIENRLDEYYIGTLVVNRGHNGYQIIDGQQRHTTLLLIHAVLWHKFKDSIDVKEEVKFNINKSNLSYEARQESKEFFDSLFSSHDSLYLNLNNNFAYTINQIILPKIQNIEDKNRKEWVKYFYSAIKLFRIEVPPETDLFHYFEAMNSRGEQLEEHEVLKAKFLSKSNSPAFSAIWDNCANLFSYIDFKANTDEEVSELMTINDILIEYENIKDNKPKEYESIKNAKQNDATRPKDLKYASIINFSNFLLIALKLYPGYENAVLNDNNLLKEFGYFNDKLPDPDHFIDHLKKCRVYFDKYFIKRCFEDNKPYWVLLNEERNTFTDEKIENDDDFEYVSMKKSLQDKIIKIESMLQSLYFSNTNKEWLYIGLRCLVERSPDFSEVETGQILYDVLYQYGKEKFIVEIDKKTLLPNKSGLNIARVVFYFTDYLLWHLYYEEARGKSLELLSSNKMNGLVSKIYSGGIKKYFNSFDFKQHSSIEHFYPRTPENAEKLKEDRLDSFGNLCLISRGSNSRYSNFMPADKMKYIFNETSRSVESLKQLMMFQGINKYIWGEDEITKHEDEMKELFNTIY